jgi:hypothetical protein
MKTNTKARGELSEAMILAAFTRKGIPVLTPFGDNQRYDMVLDTAEGFKRIQCKTGKLRNGVVQFPVASSAYHRGGKRQSYAGQVDFFGVYCPENGKCYLVPIEEAPAKNLCTLRLSAAENNQAKGIRWAADFEIM